MKINPISSILLSTGIAFTGGTSAEQNNVESTSQIVYSIVSGPQKGESNVQYLNRQLHASASVETEDMKLRKVIRESRTNLNFFMANSMSLPISIMEPEKNNSSGVEGYSERPPIKIKGIPDWLNASLGVKEISIKFTRSF